MILCAELPLRQQLLPKAIARRGQASQPKPPADYPCANSVTKALLRAIA
ncbi:MAG: hypothetical protein F6J93_24875 [Oscillatoria sp. SIO1A7]|nr:hypothetical protein [Oscillatoria sp. SIO1A7]